MESDRFDRLTRIVSRARSRRAALGALIAGAAGIGNLGAWLGPGDDPVATAKKNNKNEGKGKGKGKNNDKKRTICHCPDGDPARCNTITVGKKAAQNHLKRHCDYAGECRDEVVNPCDPDSECLPVVDTEGDVTEESDGTFTTHAEGTVFGNLIFGLPAGTTFAELASMESDFDFSEGQCGVGSPRFVVFLENDRCPYAQFPPPLCNTPGAEGNTGNLIGNNTDFVWNDDLCGGNAANNTYAEMFTAYGDVVIDQIVLVHDSSSGTATVNLEPCITVDLA